MIESKGGDHMNALFKGIKAMIPIVILVFIAISVYMKFQAFESNVLPNKFERDWQVEFPDEYTLIYEYKPERSFQGDGISYWAFSYTDEVYPIDNFFSEHKNVHIEIEWMDLLSQIDVSNEHYLNFKNNYKWIRREKDDHDVLIMIHYPEQKKLYIVELEI